jgi:CheY-like chemotaxis protein
MNMAESVTTKGLALIIEDDEDASRIFSEALRKAGYEAEIIASGDTALARLADVIPRIIVLDLHLPKVSGGVIMDYVVTDSRFRRTFVIIASADPVMAGIYREQADLVLIKPISFIQLRDLASRL